MTAALETFAHENQLTLNTLIQGAWAFFLSRYAGEDDMVFGATRACRKSALPEFRLHDRALHQHASSEAEDRRE